VIRTWLRVQWLRYRHRRGCYRWTPAGRCIDCGAQTGPNRTWEAPGR
jgi:hypothetical protein